MFENSISRITDNLCSTLLKDRENIPFGDLVHQSLPPYLWDYFNVILNPQLGGIIRIGGETYDFRSDKPNPEEIQRLKQALKVTLILNREDLQELISQALHVRINFILDPVDTVSKLAFGRNGKNIKAIRLRLVLEAMSKMFEKWDLKILAAVTTIKPYLGTMSVTEISRTDLTRLLQSAVEKEMIDKPVESVQASLVCLRNLLRLDPQSDELDKLDFTQSIVKILTHRGLASWTAAIMVEQEILGGKIGIEQAFDALKRFHLYQAMGFLGMEPDDLLRVAHEVESFTSFVEEVTK